MGRSLRQRHHRGVAHHWLQGLWGDRRALLRADHGMMQEDVDGDRALALHHLVYHLAWATSEIADILLRQIAQIGLTLLFAYNEADEGDEHHGAPGFRGRGPAKFA